MSHERGYITFLIISLWSVCTANRALFDVGLISYTNRLDDRGSSHVHFLYPTLSEGDHHIATSLDVEYLFREKSTSGYHLTVKAISNAPVAPGQYPIVAYLHGTGGFSLDSHTLLTRLVAMGFIVITSDMPGYLIGDKVHASALQRHMGELLVEVYHNCPLSADGLCEALDFDHLTVLGPGVVDAMCTLDGWTKMGLHPAAQVVLDGNVEVDVKCHPVEVETQDAGFIAVGKRDKNSILDDDVKRLLDWTDQDKGMTTYILGFPDVPSTVAFTDLCAISHNLNALRHLSETSSCGDIGQDELEDVKAITQGVISSVLFHHFWKQPIDSPVKTFEPEDYPTYIYRIIEQGLITDAVGILKTVSEKPSQIVEEPTVTGYHFRTPTVLAILPMILIAFVYVACGAGLCVRDYYIAMRSRESGRFSFAECLGGCMKRSCSFKNPIKFSFNPCPKSIFLRYLSPKRATAPTKSESSMSFLVGKHKSVSHKQVLPPSYRPPKRTTAIELISSPSKKSVSFEPLLHSTNSRKEAKSKRRLRSSSVSTVSQRHYEVLGSETETEEY